MEKKPLKIACVVDEPFLDIQCALTKELAKKGWQVTLALLDENLFFSLKKKAFHPGIKVELISRSSPQIRSLSPAVQAYALFEWLLARQETFNLVELPLKKGVGYYALLAKELGIAFQQLSFCMRCSECLQEQKEAGCQWMSDLDEIAVDFFEKESLERAQGAIIQKPAFLEWLKKNEWKLPAHLLLEQEEACLEKVEHFYLALGSKKENLKPLTAESLCLVSICLTHYNRHEMLQQALASIRAQDYPHIEVILVDDASSNQEAIAYLKSLEPEFASKGWSLLRNSSNQYPSVCRNLAAKKSRGSYLLFMDDDNIATPHEVSTFVLAAQNTDADILTCAMDLFTGPALPSKPLCRFLPLGHCAALGLHLNLFGDMNALIKKQAYEELGGLTERKAVGGEDWEFFGKAVLKGYKLRAIPLPLFWYRDTPKSITKTTSLYANSLRAMEPYLQSIPSSLHPNLILSRSQQEELQSLRLLSQNPQWLLKQALVLLGSKTKKAIKNPKKIIKYLRSKLSFGRDL